MMPFDNPGKGHTLRLKVIAALLGTLIVILLNWSWGLFTTLLAMIPGETGWQAVIFGVVGFLCLGICVRTAYITGWAYLYAGRYVDRQKDKKDGAQ